MKGARVRALLWAWGLAMLTTACGDTPFTFVTKVSHRADIDFEIQFDGVIAPATPRSDTSVEHAMTREYADWSDADGSIMLSVFKDGELTGQLDLDPQICSQYSDGCGQITLSSLSTCVTDAGTLGGLCGGLVCSDADGGCGGFISSALRPHKRRL